MTGYVDETGVVLYWQNMFAEDPTISGYQVFRKYVSNNSKAEFKPVIDSILSPKQNNFVDVSSKEFGNYEYAVKVYDILEKKVILALQLV